MGDERAGWQTSPYSIDLNHLTRTLSACFVLLYAALTYAVATYSGKASAQAAIDDDTAKRILQLIYSIADHGDLSDQSFTARELEVTIRQQQQRLDYGPGINRTEFLLDKCPFERAVVRCDYAVAQRDDQPVTRGRLTLELDPATVCISLPMLHGVFGPGGQESRPIIEDPLAALRKSPSVPSKPRSGLAGLSFEFPRERNHLSAYFRFDYQPCLREITIWQNQTQNRPREP